MATTPLLITPGVPKNSWNAFQRANRGLFGTSGEASAAYRASRESVWDAIKVTQPATSGTLVPHSFELGTAGGKFWIATNATKHMNEFLLRHGTSHGSPLQAQEMLKSLQASVGEAAGQGIRYGEIMDIGHWELIFSEASCRRAVAGVEARPLQVNPC